MKMIKGEKKMLILYYIYLIFFWIKEISVKIKNLLENIRE